jgi:hypothetical protein
MIVMASMLNLRRRAKWSFLCDKPGFNSGSEGLSRFHKEWTKMGLTRLLMRIPSGAVPIQMQNFTSWEQIKELTYSLSGYMLIAKCYSHNLTCFHQYSLWFDDIMAKKHPLKDLGWKRYLTKSRSHWYFLIEIDRSEFVFQSKFRKIWVSSKSRFDQKPRNFARMETLRSIHKIARIYMDWNVTYGMKTWDRSEREFHSACVEYEPHLFDRAIHRINKVGSDFDAPV